MFRCYQRALYIKYNNPQYRGGYGQQRSNAWERTIADGTAYCNWVGDVCTVEKCVHAQCAEKRLLPDGTCGYEDRNAIKHAKSIEDDARSVGDVVDLAKHKVLKKAGREFVE